MNDLAIIDQSTALEVFTAEKGLDPYLQEVRDEIDSFIPDLTTDKGRKAIASMAAKVSKSKTALDSVGKNLVADLKTKPKLIDAERKRARDLMDAWRDEVRKPLTDWETAKKAREDAIHMRINDMSLSADNLTGLAAEEIRCKLEETEAIVIDDSFAEFVHYAETTKNDAIIVLMVALERQQNHEAEQAELAKLRKESEEREKREREDKLQKEAAEQARLKAEEEANKKLALQKEEAEIAKREAEELAAIAKALIEKKAAKEKAEAEERESKLKSEASQAQQRIKQAEDNAEQARQQAEQRVIDAKKADDDATKAREADKQHRAKINNFAVEALLDVVDEKTAKAVMTKIIRHQVPNVVINY